MSSTLLRAAIVAALLVFLLSPGDANPQEIFQPPPAPRVLQTLPGPWKFAASSRAAHVESRGFDDQSWATVSVPHTWNTRTDWRTHKAAWYRTRFRLPAGDAGKEIYLSFDGVATLADVYVNGVLVGRHRGAYTRFIVDATPAVAFGEENVLAVQVDNDAADTADCLPAGDDIQLYRVYGGIYRKVWLLKTEPVHIDPTDYASSGVYLTPTKVTAAEADLSVKTLVRNTGSQSQTVTVTNTVCDADGAVLTVLSQAVTLGPHTRATVVLLARIANPHLWSPSDPSLYHVYAATRAGGVITDLVTERTGFRTLQMTPSAFRLNGEDLPLRGVAKHQETEDHASAVRDEELVSDFDALKDLGVNFVRLAHYPHAALEYDLADERGIAVWAENGHSNFGPATATGDRITREMVRQNYNHPSIFFWSAGNESAETQPEIAVVEHYADVIRSEDKSRLITYASHTTFHESPHLDFVAVNRYNGWYGGTIPYFEILAAKYHYFSETGAGGVISTHTGYGRGVHRVNTYEPEEYQQEVAEERCQVAFRDQVNDIPLLTWWTFRDFADPRYKGLNTKGLETYAGFRKDIYYLFQSFLRPQQPVVHLCGKTWFLRRGPGSSGIKAYSDAPRLTLTVNGQTVGMRENGSFTQPDGQVAENVFYWSAPLRPGKNTVMVDDGAGHADSAILTAAGSSPSTANLAADAPIRDLTSSNPHNPAWYIDTPVQAEWPFYDDFDGTGDNTFHAIPAVLTGATWITTGRTSKRGARTDLAFTIARSAGPMDVFVMVTAPATGPARFLTDAGFADTGTSGTWRDNTMSLEPYALYRKVARAGERVRVPGSSAAYVVLLKPHAGP